LTPTKMPLYIPQVGDMVEITTRCKHTGEVGTVTRIGKKISVSFFERGKAAYWASSLRCSRRGQDKNTRSKKECRRNIRAETEKNLHAALEEMIKYLIMGCKINFVIRFT
jgi:hypothetical protein